MKGLRDLDWAQQYISQALGAVRTVRIADMISKDAGGNFSNIKGGTSLAIEALEEAKRYINEAIKYLQKAQ